MRMVKKLNLLLTCNQNLLYKPKNKKTICYNKIPVNIIQRDIIYFGEEKPPLEWTNESLPGVNTTNDTETQTTNSKNMEDTAKFQTQLTSAQAEWLVETSTPETFPILRYYAILHKEAPSVLTYSGANIEAFALLHELKEN